MRCCWPSCTPPAASIGPVRSPTALTSGPKGDDQVDPSPVDRGRPGSKHHLLTDATGIPLAVRVTERAPSCVTGAALDGATDLELDFVTANTVKSRHVWLLSSLHAKPAKAGGATLFAPVAS